MKGKDFHGRATRLADKIGAPPPPKTPDEDQWPYSYVAEEFGSPPTEKDIVHEAADRAAERYRQRQADRATVTVSVIGTIVLVLIAIFATGCAVTWSACADPYADYPGCGDREG